MRAVQIDRFGGPEELYLAEAPDPVPAADEVLVRVAAAGVNPLDYKIRDGSSGWVKTLPLDPFPLILGRECCGEIVAVGEDVNDLEVGQRVFGMAPMSHVGACYAELAAMPARAMAPAPAELESHLLGGAALVGLTAMTAAHDLGRIGDGDIVLVHGGSGGVGSLIVQLAVAAGAEVYATASAANAGRIRDFGATHVDYRSQDFTEVVPAPDVIVDGVYFGTYEPSMDHLKPGGRLVILPSLADLEPAKARGIEVAIPAISESRERLDDLASALAAGTLTITVAEVFDFGQAEQAHRLVETGHAGGKVVLTP